LLYEFGDYALDTDRRELRRADALIAIQPQVFDLLEYLIRKRDRVVSRDDLLTEIWNGRIVSDSNLATRLNAARVAIGDDGESQRLIRTLPRKGLRFVAEVRESAARLNGEPLPAAATGGWAQPGEAWRSVSPYRGLAAMDEASSAYFFGRARETVEVLNALATEPDRLPLLLGNSGVGKSSLAQAGVLTKLRSEAWPTDAGATRPWPGALQGSRNWCYLKLQPGELPVGKIVETILDTWRLDRTAAEWPQRCTEWIDGLVGGKLVINDLLEQTRRRYADLQRPEPTGFFLYIDQGEELYVRSEEWQRRRFVELLAQAVGDGHLRGVMSLRADFFGELQKDEALYEIHRLINVPPLREGELREVVSRPAALLSARFENDHLAADIARRAAEESAKDASALPLLSYLLDDMWTKMVQRGDGVLRLPGDSIELDGVLVGRADAFVAAHPHSEESLRRIFTLKLATVREGEEPTRRRAVRSEFRDKEWSLVNDLADHPNRLLVVASPEAGEPYAEVAHEAVFRRWNKLRAWIAAEREFLAWRSGIETARRAWQTAEEGIKNDALLMGLALAQAQNWTARRRDDISTPDRAFIERSRQVAQQRKHRIQALVGATAFLMIAGLIGWINQEYLREQWRELTVVRPYLNGQVRPYVLTAAAERALKPGAAFRECAADCPEMVVLPSGQFLMGSAASEQHHYKAEEPQHIVTIAKTFAVGKFPVTFTDWDACATYGDCARGIPDDGNGRGRIPVVNVNWQDAQRYVAWLSRITGKTYRLLSEAEFEYAARAGTQTAYYWGNDVGKGNAVCADCGSAWDRKQLTLVGSFPPNPFGLYDMAGNVREWVEDCLHDNYVGAPDNGSAWTAPDCKTHVLRGGAWLGSHVALRSAFRIQISNGDRNTTIGFRVARTLDR
jgi:formylglycine-generating enzyme required for sulfatase activity/DNA-binding winged helix-turn-helix (wHTH) protein